MGGSLGGGAGVSKYFFSMNPISKYFLGGGTGGLSK